MKFAPGMVEKSAAMLVDKGGFDNTPTPSTSGNLFEPMISGADTDGGEKASGSSAVRRVAAAGAIAVPAFAVARRLLQRNAQEMKTDTSRH